MQLVNPLPIFSATWRKLALSVNYNKYKVSAMKSACIVIVHSSTCLFIICTTADCY